MHYLDNASTTRVSHEAMEMAMLTMQEYFANPSSLYAQGARAEDLINQVRESVAQSLGVRTGEVIFTSGGTEANNIAIQGALRARQHWAEHIVVTGFEHPSVQNTVAAMEKQGFRVTVVMPDETGHIDLDAMARAVGTKTALCACMHVNNEIGTILDVATLAKEVKSKNSRTAVHVDGVQAWGKLSLKLSSTMIDSYAVSGHKVHAPKGVGALYLRRGLHIEPLLYGGLQESGMRAGTQNTPAIAALGKAVQRMQADKMRCQRIQGLSERLWTGLGMMQGIVRNSPLDAVAEIANFSVLGFKSETLLHFLESKSVFVSAGSACGKGAASHTLTAMNLPRARIESALRVSFASQNTQADVDALLKALSEAMNTLQKVKK